MKIKSSIFGLIAVILSLTMVLTACGNNTIEIPMFDGSTVEVSTKDMTKEQVQALEQIAAGEASMTMLVQNGLFTQEEMGELGLIIGNRGLAAGDGEVQGGEFPGINLDADLSSLDINDLNLEGLSPSQVEAIEQAIAGERTLQSLIDEDILVLKQLRTIGLIGADAVGGGPGGGGGKGGNASGGDSDNSGGTGGDGN